MLLFLKYLRSGTERSNGSTKQFERLNAVYVDMDEEVNGSALYKYVHTHTHTHMH
jgi:hypothetical protein